MSSIQKERRCDMSKRLKQLCLLVVFFQEALLYAQESPGNEAGEKSLFPALVGGVFSNTVFHLTARVFGADFAQTSFESIKTNLASRWVWDSDSFLFNHPGHPYQGGLYHAAARSSGFTFYESVFFDALGSLTWELFGETDIPSLNDLIITTFGGSAFGEILHLLYAEIPSTWMAALVSPLDALNNAVFRKRPQNTHNLYYFSTITGPGWARAIKEDREWLQKLQEEGVDPTPSHIFAGNIGCEIIYGDPFFQHSKMPYSQFEFKMQLGGSFSPLWLDWTLLTDGYLVSFNPIHTDKNILSTGLTLHYDLIAGNTANFANNGLDWSLKWKHEFKTVQLELKSHIGWTFFGSSEYYPFFETPELRETDNDYGTGGNVKLFFSLQSRQYGKITAGVCNYLLYIIPWNKPDSKGVDFLNLTFLEYSYPFTNNLSVLANNSLYLKGGTSHRKKNMISVTNRIIIALQWTFLDKGSI
jgi:hypothetical protein